MNEQRTTTTLSSNQCERLDHLMHLPVRELASALVQETKHFVAQQSHDDLVGLALFTLAIREQNQTAWSLLYQQYESLVLTWVMDQERASPLLAQDGHPRLLINAAFAKFAHAVTPQKIVCFDSLAAVLKYLKLCVHSVVADEVRVRQVYEQEQTYDTAERELISESLENQVITALSVQDLWQLMLEEAKSEQERILLQLICLHQMTPADICHLHRQLFPTVDDVYRIKRNVVERLRRNQALRGYLREMIA